MAGQNLVDGVERQLEGVLADQLDPQALDAEAAFPAQREDERDLVRSDLAVRRGVRPAAAVVEALLVLGAAAT